LIPYTSTILILCGFQGAVAPQSLIGLSGDYYFFGCIAMNIAGIAEFILGNSEYSTFGSVGVIADLCRSVPNGGLPHLWQSLGQSRIHSGSHPSDHVSVFRAWRRQWRSIQLISRLPQRHNVSTSRQISAQPFATLTDLWTRAIASFVFFMGTFRVNVFFTLTFFGLIMLFSFIAAADFRVGHATTEADVEHINKLLHIAGGFGFIGLVCGWYLAILTACEAVGIPCPLPVLDLSSKVFPKKDATVNGE
jgi:succinate-acetate transporter protein